jgi:diguanylate cyclase (GGDEF)-like protein
VLYTITLAFVLLSMSKERSELRHKTAALVDPLTGLANRRAFMLDADAMAAGRAARNEPLAVLLADLDHFKQINDAFGHAVGDEVLRAFAGVAGGTVGAGDLVGRIGGEEFAILLPGRNEADAVAVAERVRAAFAEAAAEIDGYDIAATVSIGVAASRIGDMAGLLARADRALYQAKEGGRNRVAAFAAELKADDASAAPSAIVVPLRLRAAG